MDWFRANENWLIPLVTGIICAFIGAVSSYWFQNKKEKEDRKGNTMKHLEQENQMLKEELNKYKDLDTFRKPLKYIDAGFYARERPEGGETEYYCAKCLDSDNKKIRIWVQEDGDFICPLCKNTGLFSSQMRDAFYQESLNNMSSYDEQVQNFITYGN